MFISYFSFLIVYCFSFYLQPNSKSNLLTILIQILCSPFFRVRMANRSGHYLDHRAYLQVHFPQHALLESSARHLVERRRTFQQTGTSRVRNLWTPSCALHFTHLRHH
uniref:Secreted protein n=1 Tax=Cacopsylla melanoneura TaxID=428564 RepID=A0A8D8Z8W3_9HEMI